MRLLWSEGPVGKGDSRGYIWLLDSSSAQSDGSLTVRERALAVREVL